MSDRIFLSIAVSKPEALVELPGARTAARRMASWAEANGYRVVKIDDAEGQEVTIERIREALVRAIEEVTAWAPLRRLIVFFAGHGAAKDINVSFWLLSNWNSNSSEAVNLPAFQRILRFYGPRQVTLIGDCCSVTHDNFLDVIGSAVLERPDEEPADFELDRFYAADAGKESFMIKAEGSKDAFCIFTEVLLDALEGDAPGAFEIQLTGEPAVTSGSLTVHLQYAVPLEASRYNLVMKPKPEPGFYTDRIYVRFPPLPTAGYAPVADPGDDGGGGEPGLIFSGPTERTVPKVDLIPAEPSRGRADEDRVREEGEERLRKARAFRADFDPEDVPTHFETDCGLAVLGAEPKSVETSVGLVHRDPNRPDVWFPLYIGGNAFGMDWADVLIDFDADRHAYVCAVQGFIATLQLYNPDRASVVHRPVWENPREETSAVDLLARANAGLLSTEHLVNTAAELRRRKHADFTLGCVAAYLYDSIGDVESIRSIAAYYANAGQVVPLDVALLSNGILNTVDGKLVVDIPATADRRPRTEIETSHPFTFGATAHVEHAPVGGSAPWMRGGWTAVSTARYEKGAFGWRDRAQQVIPYLAPSPFTMVRREGRQALANLVGVRVPQPVEAD
jgi:hypothetical protein